MENDSQNNSNPDPEYTSSQDATAENTATHEEEGGKDYTESAQGGQGAKSTDDNENSTHDQGNEESIAGREDS